MKCKTKAISFIEEEEETEPIALSLTTRHKEAKKENSHFHL